MRKALPVCQRNYIHPCREAFKAYNQLIFRERFWPAAVQYPAGKIGITKENLKAAAEGEHEEWSELYPHFAEVAKAEGFPEIATAYKTIAKVEAEHERRYLKLLQNVSDDKVFMKNGKVWWRCINCGYVYESEKALETCPACLHPKAFMQLREENY